MTMSVVCATSMTSHDFGGDFNMDVPKDSNFVEQPVDLNGTDAINLNERVYMDESKIILVEYVSTSLIGKENAYIFYQFMFESVNPDLNQSYEYQDDNLRVIEPVSKDNQHFAIVCMTSGNETVMLAGQDVDLLKDMAHTIEF